MELNKIYNEDCLVTISKIKPKSIDLVIADPPYIIVAGGNGGAFGVEKRDYHKGVKTLSDGFDIQVLNSLHTIQPIINAYFFCSKDQLPFLLNWALDNKVNYDILTFIKTNPIPTTNNKYLSDTEYIVYLRSKGAYLGGSYETKKKYFLQQVNKNNIEHPTVKPINIIKTLIHNSSKPNQIVLDPFMGSGTTAIAAIQLNRQFIGAEIDPNYFNIAQQRINNEKKQLKLL